MALGITIANFITFCRQRCGHEGDDQASDVEYQALISEYYGELHALVTEKGARYFETEATITANGSATYALPSDHLSTVGVDAVLSGTTGARRPVHGPIAPQERTRLVGLTGSANWFALEGANLALYPVPSSGTYMHLYAPQPTDYSVSAASTSIDVINIYGRRMIIWGVASVVQHKGSESQQRALDEYQRARGELEFWACQRALTQPSYRVPEDDCAGVDFGGRWRFR